jgi:hypothetical protein
MREVHGSSLWKVCRVTKLVACLLVAVFARVA